MALVVADRVQETTTTTGTGTYTLAGAKDGFQSFAAVGNGNTTYYACTDGTDYEIGIGTYTASGTTLARTTIIESSNSDTAVNWGAGEKDIFVTLPASKAIFEDASNNVAVGNNITVGGTVDGRDVAADGSKLDNIEANADVTDATNVQAAGALMDSEVTNLAQVKAFDSADYATAAQGTKADNALPKAGGQMTGNITMSGAQTVDGRDLSVDGSKLDGIEAGATADQTASEILTAIKTVDGTGSGLDADLLDGQHASAFLTAHPAVSAASSSDNSGRTYIQDITLDTYGHVTGIATATETVTNTNQLTTFVLEDGDGTEVTISHGKEVKFVEGGGIDINWTDTSTGSDADPYDLTFTHADTSSQASVNNSNGTVIQDVTLDTYGHVTALGSVDLDGRYYTETEADDRFVNVTGDTMTGTLDLEGGSFSSGTDTNTTAALVIASGQQILGDDGNYLRNLLKWTSGSDIEIGQGSTALITGINIIAGNSGTVKANGQRVFAEDYHPNADTWTTGRTIALTGDVTGTSGAFNGSANLSFSTAIASGVVGANELNVTGNGTTAQFLRSDGDGSFTWATPTDTNTTYSAGSGISLSGTTFSHADTSSQASVNGSGRTYIQDITLDTYGHVTGIATATETVVNTDTTNFNIQANSGTQVNISAGEEINFINGNATTAVVTNQTNPTVTFNHNDTSSQSSVNNSNGTVIQDVTLDDYGHVTALGSVDLDGRYVNVTGDTMTGRLILPDSGYSIGDEYHAWKRSYVVNSSSPAELLYHDGNSLPNGGAYRFHAHIDGTGTDQSATAVYWNQNGTWKVNVTYQSGTSSNHPEFIIGGSPEKPQIHIDHTSNYTIQVLAERLELSEGTGTDNLAGFGADAFLGSVGGTLRYNNAGSANDYNQGNVVFHDGYHPNADKWTTGRTIALTGDVTGTSGSFDGSANLSFSTNIAANVVGANELNVTGNGTTAQFLRSDGDGSFTWATPTDTNTTYSAGTGISLSGTTFSHADTSSQASLTALTGANVVSDIDVDGFGHVTNLATRTMTLGDLGYTGETNATADQTASEILTAIKTVDGAGSGLDADTLDGVQGSNFLRSNVSDTATGRMTFTGGLVLSGNAGDANSSQLIISDIAPQIKLLDTDTTHDDFWIHVDSNNFYVLADRNESDTWATPHPMQLEADTNIGYMFGSRVFTDSYHPNADVWTTGRTIALTGDVTGTSGSFNGSSNLSFSTNIAANVVGANELNVSGNGTTAQFLRSDGDGTFTWATPTDTNTTYSAGSGISLSGTTFSHSDTSSQASVNNSGNTFIQDITVDTYGHITALTSATATASANDDIFWENGQNVSSNYTITNGKNAMSAGPITINSGVTVTVGSGETWTVV